jgi:GT2 family glycosyltransferase
MHEAFAFAMKRGFRAYLWLNDDTMLNKDAFLKIFEALENNADEAAIVVGAVKDPVYGEIAYGGGRLTSPVLRPFRYQMVQPNGSPKRVDVMNGNVVWIPGVVAQRLGNLDPIFEHGMGDIDYAMRASKNEIGIVQTPGFVGECPRNSIAGTYQDSRLPLRIRLEKIFSKKGLPWRTWFVMCARHGGAFWPIHFLWPYFKVLINRA